MGTTPDTNPKNPFLTVLNGVEPKLQLVQEAVELLQEMLDRKRNELQAKQWAPLLTRWTSEQLACAFMMAAMTVRGWPILADLVDPLLDEEYTWELADLLRGLRTFGPAWENKPAVYGERFREPGAGIDDWKEGALVQASVPAPKLSNRMVLVLERVGGADAFSGLAYMAKHPAVSSPSMHGDDALRIKFQVERDFKAAWFHVRKAELGRNS